MTPTDKYLQPHSIFGELNFDEYCSRIPEFYFRKEVPEDVVQNFEVIKSLLALSYYEYRLIDEAFVKALHTFEMAMSIRYKDFFPENRKLMFNSLIHELSKLNMFDTSIETLKQVKGMRNHYSHPERHSFAGMFIWKHIEHTSHLINEMYEDVDLRLERKAITENFNNQLAELDLNEFSVMEIQGEKSILFSIQLLLINNKREPFTCLLACTPLFNLEQDENSVQVPFVFKSKLANPIFENGILSGKGFNSKEQVTFSPISKHPELLSKFESWKSEYDKKGNKFLYDSRRINIPEIFIPELRKFQKM